jgi:hypothetical protein
MNFLRKLVTEWGLLDILEQSYPTSLVVKIADAAEKDLIARDRLPQSESIVVPSKKLGIRLVNSVARHNKNGSLGCAVV